MTTLNDMRGAIAGRGGGMRGRSWSAGRSSLGALAVALAIPFGPSHRDLLAQERPVALGGALTGRVVDAVTTEGIAGVEVSILDTALGALTDSHGGFRIDPINPGTLRVRFSRIGYGERTDTIEVPVGQVLAVTASLAEEPVELAPLTIAVRSAVLDRAGFYERRSQGMRGHFLERGDIEDRRPDAVTDLFRRMNGIRVIHGGIYGSQVLVNQRVTFKDSSAGCEPSIWLDGIRSTMPTPDDIKVEELEGIEVYTGASAPGRFNDICGVVVLWTRQRRTAG
ncbi:MAG: carboxypeptidase-like regulatory domain-containing protein [Gemmatimonadetes bacterium]|nr:carboxypeptidase-like regulatory domain-containing protein [Gemmatimonadota bacterium]